MEQLGGQNNFASFWRKSFTPTANAAGNALPKKGDAGLVFPYGVLPLFFTRRRRGHRGGRKQRGEEGANEKRGELRRDSGEGRDKDEEEVRWEGVRREKVRREEGGGGRREGGGRRRREEVRK